MESRDCDENFLPDTEIDTFHYTTPSSLCVHAHPHHEKAHMRATKSDRKRLSRSSDKYGSNRHSMQVSLSSQHMDTVGYVSSNTESDNNDKHNNHKYVPFVSPKPELSFDVSKFNRE